MTRVIIIITPSLTRKPTNIFLHKASEGTSCLSRFHINLLLSRDLYFIRINILRSNISNSVGIFLFKRKKAVISVIMPHKNTNYNSSAAQRPRFSSFFLPALYPLLQFSVAIGQLYPCKCIGAALQFHTGKSLITPGAGDIS